MKRIALLAGAALALLPAGPATAAPGQLTQYLLALPDGTPSPAGPWIATGGSGGFNGGTLNGGPLQMDLPAGAGQSWNRGAQLSPPAGLTFATARANRRFEAPAGSALLQPQIITTWEARGDVDSVPGYGGDVDDGWVAATNPSSLSVQIRCANTVGGYDPAPNCTPASFWLLRRLELSLADAVAPTASVDGSGGALLDGTWQTVAAQTATLRGSDVGSGVYRYFLRDGVTTIYALADPASATCRDARPGVGDAYEFTATTTSLVPCKTTDRSYAPTFALTSLGDGTHTGLTLGVEDASGRETVIDAALTLRINAPGGSLADPGTPCTNGTTDESGACALRAPAIASPPVLTGTPSVLGVLATDTGGWVDATGATFAYAWELCDALGGACAPLAGESAPTLALTAAMADHTVRSVVTATTTGGSAVSRSAPSYPISGAGLGGAAGAGGVVDVIASPSSGGGGGGGGGARRTTTAADALPVPPIVVSVRGPNGRGAEDTARVSAERRGGAISGRLLTGAGAPIAGAQIDVIVQAATRGAHGQVAGAVSTDDAGRFTFALPAAATGRIFTFGYREHLSDDHYVHWASVRVSDPPTLFADRTAVPNGRSVLFRGTAADGVELQVQVRHRWTTIATPRRRGGAFAYRYRFTRTHHTTTYRFRVLSPGGPSNTTSVRVTAKESR